METFGHNLLLELGSVSFWKKWQNRGISPSPADRRRENTGERGQAAVRVVDQMQTEKVKGTRDE